MGLRYILPLVALFTVPVRSQDFISLTNEDGDVVNGTTVVFEGLANSSVDVVHLVATLLAGPTREVNVRRYELDVEPYTQNYFCWGLCYAPQDAGAIPAWSSMPEHSLDLEAGVGVSNFGAYHMPLGVEGSSTYRFVWYDVASPTDTVWADIRFQSTAVGIMEHGNDARLMIFPNPSKGADVQFDVELTNATGAATLVIHNTLGERVRTSTLRTGQPVARLSTEGFAPGLYFASIDVQGRTLVTQRFVVSGR